MSAREGLQPCALFARREDAEAAVRALQEAGIEARIEPPDERYARVPPGCWQVAVPGTAASRARALLDARRG